MKNRNKKLNLCPVCGADLRVWNEMGLGEHNHYEVPKGNKDTQTVRTKETEG